MYTEIKKSQKKKNDRNFHIKLEKDNTFFESAQHIIVYKYYP